MKLAEYLTTYVTPENQAEYQRQTDKLAWVSDLIGLSVDHRYVEVVEDFLDGSLLNHISQELAKEGFQYLVDQTAQIRV